MFGRFRQCDCRMAGRNERPRTDNFFCSTRGDRLARFTASYAIVHRWLHVHSLLLTADLLVRLAQEGRAPQTRSSHTSPNGKVVDAVPQLVALVGQPSRSCPGRRGYQIKAEAETKVEMEAEVEVEAPKAVEVVPWHP
jgi:hypothetical protein